MLELHTIMKDRQRCARTVLKTVGLLSETLEREPTWFNLAEGVPKYVSFMLHLQVGVHSLGIQRTRYAFE